MKNEEDYIYSLMYSDNYSMQGIIHFEHIEG